MVVEVCCVSVYAEYREVYSSGKNESSKCPYKAPKPGYLFCHYCITTTVPFGCKSNLQVVGGSDRSPPCPPLVLCCHFLGSFSPGKLLLTALLATLIWQERGPAPESEHVEHLQVLVAVVIGRGQQLIAVEDGVGTGQEAQGLVGEGKVHAPSRQPDDCLGHEDTGGGHAPSNVEAGGRLVILERCALDGHQGVNGYRLGVGRECLLYCRRESICEVVGALWRDGVNGSRDRFNRTKKSSPSL